MENSEASLYETSETLYEVIWRLFSCCYTFSGEFYTQHHTFPGDFRVQSYILLCFCKIIEGNIYKNPPKKF